MIKYVPEMTSVVMEEIPDMVTLAVDISNCTGLCEGCHSPFLRRDVGEELTPQAVESMLSANFGINCFLFLGEGNDHAALLDMASYIRSTHPPLSLALYSGRENVEDDIFLVFDYVKIGPYRPACGPLNNPGTNQRLYRVHHGDMTAHDADLQALVPSGLAAPEAFTLEDITSRFWHRGIDPRHDNH